MWFCFWSATIEKPVYEVEKDGHLWTTFLCRNKWGTWLKVLSITTRWWNNNRTGAQIHSKYQRCHLTCKIKERSHQFKNKQVSGEWTFDRSPLSESLDLSLYSEMQWCSVWMKMSFTMNCLPVCWRHIVDLEKRFKPRYWKTLKTEKVTEKMNGTGWDVKGCRDVR